MSKMSHFGVSFIHRYVNNDREYFKYFHTVPYKHIEGFELSEQILWGEMHGALPTMISLHIEKTTIYEVGYSVPRLRQSQNVAGLKRGLGSQPILVIQIN